MSCYITCLLGAGLLGGTLSTMLFKRTDKSKELERSLEKNQIPVYRNIVKERRLHYLQGTLLGVILASVYLMGTGGLFKSLTKGFNACAFTLIALGTTYLYYSLMPKSDYLLHHLKGEQVTHWLNHYVEMKRNYLLGFLVSGLAYVLIAYAIL